MDVNLEHRQRVTQMMRAYRESQVLIACAELAVFETLGSASKTALDVARQVGVDASALARLMNAAVAVGLLEKDGEMYRNSPVGLACLAEPGPTYVGNLVRREGAFYRRWSRLTEAVQIGGRPVENVRDEGSNNWVREFQYALYDLARTNGPSVAAALAPLLPQDRPARVIDIGGGHGGYSLALAKHYPGLEAIVFDLPPVQEVTEEIIASEDMQAHVRMQPGNFKSDELGSGYDLALLFGVLVSETQPDSVALLRKTHAALNSGGWIVLRGFYLNRDRTGPLESTLFDLHMLLSTGAGGAHTLVELSAWLQEAGFLVPDIIQVSDPEQTRLLVAQKLLGHVLSI
ncbi:MAG: methyltransferase [Anaerolineae bacterium]